MTESSLRPQSQRVEKRREEKRAQQDARLGINRPGSGSNSLNITSAANLRDRGRDANPTPAPLAQPFKPGEKVRHHKFGDGVVLDVKPSGSDQEVTVMFKSSGTRRLLASMARLERV
jgi:DNA helicase-2/ATP-dependent DNA helicase PcrA